MTETMKAQLILEDGTVFVGYSFGHVKEVVGELVFSTSMGGYQELLTDPALNGQILSMSYPLIGNYGLNLEDMASDRVQIRGLVVREKCDKPNNFRCEMELLGFLKQHKVMGIEGIDTRALTRIIRDRGNMKAIITNRGDDMTPSQIKQKFETFSSHSLVFDVTCAETYKISGGKRHLAILDLGLRRDILNILKDMNVSMTVFPATATSDDILAVNPDAVLISSGPGGLEHLSQIVETVKALSEKKPVVGVGLGYLVLAAAFGGVVKKLKYGRHGNSYAVKNVNNQKIVITNQNMDYVLEQPGKDTQAFLKNVNDGHIEGFITTEGKHFGVSFYPNNVPCPNNTAFFFTMLQNIMEGGKANA